MNYKLKHFAKRFVFMPALFGEPKNKHSERKKSTVWGSDLKEEQVKVLHAHIARFSIEADEALNFFA